MKDEVSEKADGLTRSRIDEMVREWAVDLRRLADLCALLDIWGYRREQAAGDAAAVAAVDAEAFEALTSSATEGRAP